MSLLKQLDGKMLVDAETGIKVRFMFESKTSVAIDIWTHCPASDCPDNEIDCTEENCDNESLYVELPNS